MREAQGRPVGSPQSPRLAVWPSRPPELYLAFLHLLFFLLFLLALGSLLRGSLQQGILPLPSPHLLQGQGTGSMNSATLQPAPSPGDRLSTGAATASPKSPSIRADGSSGAEPAGRALSRQPRAAKAKQAVEQGGISGSGAPERSPSVRKEEHPGLQGTGTFSCSSLLSASASCNCLSSSVLEIGGSGFCQQRKWGDISACPQLTGLLGGPCPHHHLSCRPSPACTASLRPSVRLWLWTPSLVPLRSQTSSRSGSPVASTPAPSPTPSPASASRLGQP